MNPNFELGRLFERHELHAILEQITIVAQENPSLAIEFLNALKNELAPPTLVTIEDTYVVLN